MKHKSADSSFFKYKTHLAIIEKRIILEAVVISGEKGDGPVLLKLQEISLQNGIAVDTIIGDASYSGKENLSLSGKQKKILTKPKPSISQSFRKNKNKFHYNKDADIFVFPQVMQPYQKIVRVKKMLAKSTESLLFDVGKCFCPLKNGFYKDGAKTKTYSVSIKSNLHREQIIFQETDHYLQKSKHRYRIS